ncbi:MAG: hypothetical protein HEEMFOPI_00072 [Holosporales bacterium]
MSILEKIIPALLIYAGSTFASENADSGQIQPNSIRRVSEYSVEYNAAYPQILGVPLTCAQMEEFKEEVYYPTQHDKENRAFGMLSSLITSLDFSELFSQLFPRKYYPTHELNDLECLLTLKKESRLRELLTPANNVLNKMREEINQKIETECKEANEKIKEGLDMKEARINESVRIYGPYSHIRHFDESDDLTLGLRLAPYYKKIEDVERRYEQDPELIASQKEFSQIERLLNIRLIMNLLRKNLI